MRKISGKPMWRNILQNTWPVLLKNIKNKDEKKIHWSLKKVRKEKQWPNTISPLEEIMGEEKNIRIKTSEIQVKSWVSVSLFSHSVVSDSLRPHEPQHARPSCPSPTPRACSNSCLSSQWCHLTISFSVIPFSSCP